MHLLCCCCGLSICVAEYEDLAVSLAMETERLFRARRRLEDTRDSSPAFDTRRWVRGLEDGLLAVWQRREDGVAPDHVVVADPGTDVDYVYGQGTQILGPQTHLGDGGNGGLDVSTGDGDEYNLPSDEFHESV